MGEIARADEPEQLSTDRWSEEPVDAEPGPRAGTRARRASPGRPRQADEPRWGDVSLGRAGATPPHRLPRRCEPPSEAPLSSRSSPRGRAGARQETRTGRRSPRSRLQIRRPLSAAPAATALEGDFVADTEQSETPPIFGELRSNWLSDEDEERRGARGRRARRTGLERRRAAESADRPEGTTRTGLPVRRPGGRLVPGGVSQDATKVVRDPEAIRNRLAAHAAGVSRGRAAAAAEPFTDDYAHEETGPA